MKAWTTFLLVFPRHLTELAVLVFESVGLGFIHGIYYYFIIHLLIFNSLPMDVVVHSQFSSSLHWQAHIGSLVT